MKKFLVCSILCILISLLGVSASAEYSYADGVMTFYGQETVQYSFLPKVPEGEKVHTIVIDEGVKHVQFGNTFDSGVKTLVLPSTLESINDNLFNCLLRLEEIKMPKSGKFHAENGVLFCGKELWHYPAEKKDTTYVVPSNTEKIASCAFALSNNFESHRPLESVTVYGDIADHAFSNSRIKTATIYSKNIGDYAFRSSGLEQVTFSEGLLSIGKRAFYFCEGLTELTLPASLQTLGEEAFGVCGSLKSVTILGELFLPESAFISCKDMETFHAKGTHWDLSPFSSTFKLKDIYIGKLTGPIRNLPPYSENIFYGGSEEEWKSLCTATRTVYMFYHKTGIEKVTIEPVALMEGYPGGYLNPQKTAAWYTDENYILHVYGTGKADHNGYAPWINTGEDPYVMHLKGLIVHEGISELGSNFGAKFRYDFIDLPKSLNKIHGGCFNQIFADYVIIRSNCLEAMSFLNAKPEAIIFTEDVTYIPGSAFQAVTGMKRVTIPKTIKSIGSTNFSAAGAVSGSLFSFMRHIYYTGTKEEYDQMDNMLKHENVYSRYAIHYNALPFVDVYPEMWHHDYVKALYEKDIIKGMSVGLFEPDGTLTWGQAMKILVMACGASEQAPTATHWASGYLSYAQKLGWISTLPDPDASISRLEFCQVAAKAKNLTDQPAVNPFGDTADPSVLALVQAEVINGTSATTFDPNGTLTRGQIAKIVTLLGTLGCDHNHLATVVEPLYDMDGYTLHTCQKCGHFYKDTYTHALKDIADFTPVIVTATGFRTDGWKSDDYGSGEWIIGDRSVAGKFTDHLNYNRQFYKEGVTRDQAQRAINSYGGNVHSLSMFEAGIVNNYGQEGKFAKVVQDENGRLGINVFGWRKDNSNGSASALNLVMEAFCYFTKDKNVAYALWSWIDASNINGTANSNDFGFQDVSWEEGVGGVITMNGINITVVEEGEGTTYYFN